MSQRLMFDLQFFSADSEGRTEKATSKKREDARKEGQVAKSNELNTAVLLMLFFTSLGALATYYLDGIIKGIESAFNNIPFILEQTSTEMLLKTLGTGLQQIVILNGPLWLILFVGALVVSLLQVGYKPTFKPLTPKFSKMNPLKGMKKIVSKDMLVELIKSLGKVIFLGAIFLSVIQEAIVLFFKFPQFTTMQIMNNIG
ncbi:MAG: EscU/YscU/HrcU family type III secretion system export apparatus switch protein, partial [Cellulosilyticaceae bacterium]